MLIIGADYHQGFRQTAFGDSETGEWRPLFAPLPRNLRSGYAGSECVPEIPTQARAPTY
jgi:hypothetical protein